MNTRRRIIGVFAVGLIVLSGCAPSPTGKSSSDSHPSTSPRPKQEFEELHVTNMSTDGTSGPAGVIVKVPKGTKTKPYSIYELMPQAPPGKKVPEVLVTPLDSRVMIQYGVVPDGMKSSFEASKAEVFKNRTPDAVKIDLPPKSGYYLDSGVDPQMAKVLNLEGTWYQRYYYLMSPEDYVIVIAQWSSKQGGTRDEAVALAESVIKSIKTDTQAKKVDLFPGAGSEPNGPIPQGTEIAMPDGMILEADTPVGNMKIEAGPDLKRSYTWEGATRSVIMYPRGERWYGSKGLYYPGPGNHWEEHNGIQRGVLQEGQQNFKSVEEAMGWLKERTFMKYVYTKTGLVIGWSKTLERQQLNVEVWQITINGKPPASLPGADDSKIKIIRRGRK